MCSINIRDGYYYSCQHIEECYESSGCFMHVCCVIEGIYAGTWMCDKMLASIFVALSKEFGWANIFTDASSTSWVDSGNIWQGNTFTSEVNHGVGTVRRSQFQTSFSALSVNGIWFPGKSVDCSLPGSDSIAAFWRARFTVYFIRERPCNNNSSSYIERGQGSPVNKPKMSKPIVKAINC